MMDVAELRAKARNGSKILDGPPPRGTHPVAWEAIEVLMRSHLKLLDRIEAIEAGVKLRGTFRGVWEPGREYPKGSFVTRAGSLWHANKATTARPGDGVTPWQLAVKQGRAAALNGGADGQAT